MDRLTLTFRMHTAVRSRLDEMAVQNQISRSEVVTKMLLQAIQEDPQMYQVPYRYVKETLKNRRRQSINIAATAKEVARIKEIAKQCGLSASEWARRVVNHMLRTQYPEMEFVQDDMAFYRRKRTTTSSTPTPRANNTVLRRVESLAKQVEQLQQGVADKEDSASEQVPEDSPVSRPGLENAYSTYLFRNLPLDALIATLQTLQKSHPTGTRVKACEIHI